MTTSTPLPPMTPATPQAYMSPPPPPEAIRERQLKLQAAASKARAVKRRAEIVKAERTRERAREVLKKNCWECWKGGQDILWCKCNMRQNINAFYLGAGSSK